jgi:hypothetical protein
MARKRITWTAEARAPKQRLPHYVPNKPFADPVYESICTVGSMWQTTQSCSSSTSAVGVDWASEVNDRIYIVPTFYGSVRFPAGSMAVFVGTTRVSEAKGNTVIDVLRPTFIINGIKVLAADLEIFRPLGDLPVTSGKIGENPT